MPKGPIFDAGQGGGIPANSYNPTTMNPRRLQATAGSLHLISGINSLAVCRQGGEALLIVLLFLVLISALMLSFYSGITDEASSTTAWRNAVTTRELADSAVYLDIAQIRDATAGFAHNADGSLDLTTSAGWSSQPGAIRVFSTNFPNAGAILYKLYSAPSLVDFTGNGNPSNDLPPPGWTGRTALYVDLNAPVWSASLQTNVYPIMDPTLAKTNPSTGLANPSSYVDGFTINANTPTLQGASNKAAMPVSWLYVLRDGTIIAPDSSSTTTASFASASSQPTSNNPIVGRIAFWTDDETCKLNINTASEGAPWNVAAFQSLEDLHAQNSSPAGNEFNRFLGHPASVSLSPVLWGYFGFPHPASLIWSTPGSSGTGTNYEWGYYAPVMPAILSDGLATSATNYVNALFGQSNLVEGILPRIGWATNGSVFGGVNLLLSNRTSFLQQQSLKNDRFYATMDELFFSTDGGRTANSDLLSPQTVDRMRFFLTAQSRAPEVNIFNLPRICLWPLSDTNVARTNTVNPYLAALSGTARWSLPDKLIAQCSTLGTNAYYFTRFDPTSQTADFQGRNVTLYGYLANLLQTPMPGFSGGSFQSRWGTVGCYEEATLIYDYIRGCINLVDSYGSTTGPGGTDATNPAQRYAYSYTCPPTNTVSNNSRADSIVSGTGQVAPITITTNGVTTRGQGRFPILKSATLVFCAVAADQPPLMINTNTRLPITPTAVNPLHPFLTTITNSIVITNANYEGTNPFTPIISTNQFPSYYPTNLLAFTPYPTSATNRNVIGNDLWVTNIANTTTSSVAPIATNLAVANVFIRASNAPYGNCALTITHPGLVYGGDLNPFTGAFDGLNIFFGSNTTILGIATNVSTSYINGWATNQNPVTLKYAETNYTTTTSLTLGDPSQALFPRPYQTVMQPVLILNHGLTTPGFAPYGPSFKIRVTGLGSLQADAQTLFNGGASGRYAQFITNIPSSGWGGSSFGPDLGVAYALLSNSFNNMTNGVTNVNTWPFLGNLVKVTNTASPNFGRTFAFGGGTLTIEYLKPTAAYTTASSNDILQTIKIAFPGATFPTPKLPPFNGVQGSNTVCFYSPTGNTPTYIGTVATNYPPNFINPRFLFPSNSLGANTNFATRLNTSYNMGWFFMPELYAGGATVPIQGYSTATTLRSVEVAYGDWRLPAMMQAIDASGNQPTVFGNYGYTLGTATNLYTPHLLYFGTNEPATSALGTNFFWRSAHTLRGQIGFYAYANAGHPFLSWGMYVQGLNNATNGAYNGEPGLIYNGAYAGPSGTDTPRRMIAHLSHRGSWSDYPDALSTADFGSHLTSPPGTAFPTVWNAGGDFDNPPGGAIMDGPYINKADEGSAGWVDNSAYGWGAGAPYNGWDPAWGSVGRSRFSPNRQVPSAGILGSLPAGFDPSKPSITNAWKSLVFCPNPNASNRVAAMGNPPDYMIMDLFNMPVVQPYPISDPFSTAGRVNLNYQIAPFSYIKRDSALRGVLKSIDITAAADQDADSYKYYGSGRNIPNAPPNSPTNNYYYRYPVHLDQTLDQFSAKFSTNGFFRSGAEICSMWLYPALSPNGASASYATNPAVPLVTDTPGSNANIFSWWYANPGTTRKGITGANMRTRPYTGIYGNITTKSNTYQIHYRVQTLRQTPNAHGSGNYATWIDPAAGGFCDKVLGDIRGSAVIERFIDPGSSVLPDFAGQVAANGAKALTNPANVIDSYYQYRILNSKTFAP